MYRFLPLEIGNYNCRQSGIIIVANQRAIVWDLFVYDAIAFVAMLLIQLSGGFNLLGWGIVAIYLFFALGFGYFLLPERRPT